MSIPAPPDEKRDLENFLVLPQQIYNRPHFKPVLSVSLQNHNPPAAVSIVQKSIHKNSRQRQENDVFVLGFKVKITFSCFFLKRNPMRRLLFVYPLRAQLCQVL